VIDGICPNRALRTLVVVAGMAGLACGNDASRGKGNAGEQGGQGASAGNATGGGAGAGVSGGGGVAGMPGGGAANGGTAAAGMGGIAGSDTAGSSGVGGSQGGSGGSAGTPAVPSPRSRTLLDQEWRFRKGDPSGTTTLGYASANVKAFVLPTGNPFVKNAQDRAMRPSGNLGDGVSFIGETFDDSTWTSVAVPHDYAIAGPYTNSVSGSMGHLPSPGAVWYRKSFMLGAEDEGKSIFLDIDGAMSWSLVWLNGTFVGGWPFGYASFRLDLTPYAKQGANAIAVRLETPTPAGSSWDQGSSRWYPGAGLYRNVWLVKTAPVHVGQWGTYVTTPQVSASSATVRLAVTVDNDSTMAATVSVATSIYELDASDRRSAQPVAMIAPVDLQVPADGQATADTMGTIASPKLWGVPPSGTPNRYVAVTTVTQGSDIVDAYETPFGVRTLTFSANSGFSLNGTRVQMQGVNNHHDLGALGAAINVRAIERQFELLAEMGANGLRTAHNPPAPEVLDLADRMGFLVMDEVFDVWEQQKAALDFHLIFADWHEQDLRAFVRRDRNHPSVVMWSTGNEIGEQGAGAAGGTLATQVNAIVREEDPTRPTVSGMNSATSTSQFAAAFDTVGLNYQGSGVRDGPAQYPVFHAAFPSKFIVGTETTDAYSSRGVYTFPVEASTGVPVSSTAGQDNTNRQVSSYDLYHASWSYPPDTEFASLDTYNYVGGEFVWTGFDHLGEPTPFDSSRSSYCGILDLAGFKKDRFYLYQARWRPDHPMVHMLPHWTWPDRVGQVTPVHVYTSGNEAELFLNGQSLGRKTKMAGQYRLRWDTVTYAAGELGVVAYKNGTQWATATVETVGSATKLLAAPDRATVRADGKDLSFVTVTVADAEDRLVPRSMNPISFAISGPGEIVATDNGDPTDTVVFSSPDRRAFNGLALAIVRSRAGQLGSIVVTATSQGLTQASAAITAQ
jgi:beta-galactosidase